jgi:D-amino-acid dehydrogenase
LRVIVVGGGAVGVTVAYYLSRRGADVTLFETNELGHGASFGNAGLLVPSYSTPLASRANALEGIRSLFGRPSAVDVKIWPNLGAVPWLLRFLVSSGPAASDRGLRALAAFTRRSVTLYDELLSDGPADVYYSKSGTLYVSKTEESLAAGVQLAARLAPLGLASVVMDRAQAREHEPALASSIAGAVWYPDDARLQPLNFTRTIADRARSNGAQFRTDSVTGFTLGPGRSVTGVQTAAESFSADRVVIAAGASSPSVVSSLGLRVPILPAKGYSFDLKLARNPKTSMLFAERHVSLTPMGDAIRATTGLDLHGYDASVSAKRIDLIHTAYGEYLDSPQIVEQGPAWAGFRPLTPDGLPIVGPSSRIDNLVFATGHGPLGVTLAPATGEAVAQAILDESSALDEALLPRRFGI